MATVHGVPKSQTRLSNSHFHFHFTCLARERGLYPKGLRAAAWGETRSELTLGKIAGKSEKNRLQLGETGILEVWQFI